uniref:MFS transporter n=1 Tax=Alistipes shahii TaxID=328814 RepID=UPI003FEE1C92
MNRAGRTVYPILLMVCATHLLNDMMQSVIPAVYPLLKEKFGFTFAQIGLITLVFQLTSSLLQPVAGRLADLHPRPYSLAAGMCFTLCGLLALAAAPGFALILVSVGLIGCGSSVFHPESSRVAQLASGGRKGLAQSIFQVGGNAGSAMGPLLAALIVIPFGQASIGWFALAIGELLRTTHYTLQEIAYMCGFSAQSHFTDFCKRNMGSNPTSIRQESRI